jgi:hypothetical protein
MALGECGGRGRAELVAAVSGTAGYVGPLPQKQLSSDINFLSAVRERSADFATFVRLRDWRIKVGAPAHSLRDRSSAT